MMMIFVVRCWLADDDYDDDGLGRPLAALACLLALDDDDYDNKSDVNRSYLACSYSKK